MTGTWTELPRITRSMLFVGLAVGSLLTAAVSFEIWPSRADQADVGSPPVGEADAVYGIDLVPSDPFDDLEPGRTRGDDAVSRLRDAGYVVFDYTACSDDVERGRLVQVQDTFTGEVILARAGRNGPGERVEVLNVLISSGQGCS